MMNTSPSRRQFFRFEAKFGWAELIAVLALFVAALPQLIPDDPAKKIPKPLVVQAELLPIVPSSQETAFHVTIKNAGKYPIEGLQFAFRVPYAGKDQPS